MLDPSEFTVGTFGDAAPRSLILPRSKYEAAAIVGETSEGAATAVLLEGQHKFSSFTAAGNTHWRGLIVPGVGMEVDESTLFDPDQSAERAGAVMRAEDKLYIFAISERMFRQVTPVVLCSGLLPASGRAAFTKWRVVLRRGQDTYSLYAVDATSI